MQVQEIDFPKLMPIGIIVTKSTETRMVYTPTDFLVDILIPKFNPYKLGSKSPL